MVMFSFTKNIINGDMIGLYNYGDMKRDWTYVEDIVQGISVVGDDLVKRSEVSHEIYNIGYGEQVQLRDFVAEIEDYVGKKAIIELWPKHPADVPATWSDTTKIRQLGYNPQTSIRTGVRKFIDWYREYYKV
jgi:UDP-glucuronate 4-epimerase